MLRCTKTRRPWGTKAIPIPFSVTWRNPLGDSMKIAAR